MEKYKKNEPKSKIDLKIRARNQIDFGKIKENHPPTDTPTHKKTHLEFQKLPVPDSLKVLVRLGRKQKRRKAKSICVVAFPTQ